MGAELLYAYSLDMLLGEPEEKWHPVCWMGKVIDLADWAASSVEDHRAIRRICGVLTAAALPAGTYYLSRGFLRLVPAPLKGITEIAMLSSSLAARSLFDGARSVEQGLYYSVEEGRVRVSRIVGRDTDDLDEDEVIRAAVESVAENANDGVVAPIIYGLIGGAPLALTYKMINTLDSMIGYRSLQYEAFGWAAARLDDIAGFIPSRVTAMATAAASPLVDGSPSAAIEVWQGEASKHQSPNAGVCEAAFAGALGVQLGGQSHYSGVPVNRPTLGEGMRKPAREDISRSASLMYAASSLVLLAGLLIRWLLNRSKDS